MGEIRVRAVTREQRIRALAGQIAYEQARCTPEDHDDETALCKFAIERASEIVDAIDALPVPGNEIGEVCDRCSGRGGWKLAPAAGAWDECPNCNGTGRQEGGNG